MNSYCVFDFETTGLDPQNDKVIEMAAVRVRDNKVIGEFSTLINNGPITERITEITGIREEWLEHGMSEVAAFKYLLHFMGDSVLIAHNATFDLAFLHYGMVRTVGGTFNNSFYDTLTLSRDRHFYPHKLSDMCDRYEIALEGAHRALNDVHACWELFKAFDDEKPVAEWINKLGYLNKYGPPRWVPDHAEIFGTDNKYEPRSG